MGEFGPPLTITRTKPVGNFYWPPSFTSWKDNDTILTLFVKDVVSGYIKKCWNKPSERSIITHLDLFMYLLFVSGIFENNK